MSPADWSSDLDLSRAAANVTSEFKGDWFKDPWGWPELDWLAHKRQDLVLDRCRSSSVGRVALIDVPKENWGTRPAVVLDVVDRLMYQGLVDSLSLPLIGGLPSDVFGWRLAPVNPARGEYASNKIQWDEYRARLKELASLNEVALKTDIVSFFSSIAVEVVSDAIEHRTRNGPVARRLISFLEQSQRPPSRVGLPQRSLASSVLANMILGPVDDVLAGYKSTAPPDNIFGRLGPGFTRWMDDIWLFLLDDPAGARQAQRELQNAAQEVGLHLNSSKTDLLEGPRVAAEALNIEHSAVDEAIEDEDDFGKLEEMITGIIEDPDHAGRTTVRFAVSRMLKHNVNYRDQDLVSVAARMPHVADSLAQLFKARFTVSSLQDWFKQYAESEWASFPWAVAQYGRMFSSGVKPRQATRDFFMEKLADADTELQLLALSAQRLSRWDKAQCRALVADVMRRTDNPQSRRVLALAALAAGTQPRTVRNWLRAQPENATTFEYLNSVGFHAPQTRASYAR